MNKRERKRAAQQAMIENENVQDIAVETPAVVVEQPTPEQGAAVLAEDTNAAGDMPIVSTDDEIDKELAAAANLVSETPVNETPAESEQPVVEEPKVETPATPVATDPIVPVFPANMGSTPFAIIWTFLAANTSLPRKAQIAAMIAYGLNPNTVKTQVSRYYKVGGDKALWLAQEKMKRADEKAKIDAMVAEIRAQKLAEEAAAAAAEAEQAKADEHNDAAAA